MHKWFPKAGVRRTYKTMVMGLIAAGLFWAGCSGSGVPAVSTQKATVGTAPLVVAVTVEPLNWLVSQIGGDAVRAITVVPPGQNHETWEPAPGHMDSLRQAAVYFESGMPFEESLISRLRGLNPSLEAVCLLDTVTEKWSPPEDPVGKNHQQDDAQVEETEASDLEADHGINEHEHHHAHGDPHFWTDPRAMAAAAEQVAAVLEKQLPEHTATIRERLESVLRTLTDLDRELAGMLASCRGRRYYVFHPETGWFARRYGLIERAAEQHGKAPGARALDDLAKEIRKTGASVLLTQPGYSVTEVQALARQLNLQVREMNLMIPDYPEAMRGLARTLVESFPRNTP